MLACSIYAQDSSSAGWAGKYVFENTRADVTYRYAILIDKKNDVYVANVQITGGYTRQDILCYTKLDGPKIHLFFSGYRDYDDMLFKYGDIIATLERKPINEVDAYIYGFEPLPKKDAVLKEKKKELITLPEGMTVNGYAETYYVWDTDKDKEARQYAATSPYRDEFRLVIAQISGAYSTKRFRSAVALHFGDLPDVNWPDIGSLKFVQEANIGFSPVKGLWFDFGYFITHIGAESIFPRYNFFNTFALVTYFEPIYQSGIRISYNTKKFYGQLHLLNGYNRLTDNNKNKSVGLQLGFKPNKYLDFTYNNIFGNEEPAENNNPKLRLQNNFVVKVFAGKYVDMLIGFDAAYQQKSQIADTSRFASMYSGLFAVRVKPHKKFSISARYEYHNDKDSFLSGTFLNSNGELTGLIAQGFTLGVEFNPVPFGFLRLEGRYLMAKNNQKIFHDNKNTRLEVVFSAGAGF
jgi:hypothetical protein